MLAVLDKALFGSGCALELTAAVGVANRDVEGGLSSGTCSAGDANAATDEGAQHGEEAGVLRLDGGGVLAVLIDVSEAVEQVLARHANVVEAQGAVIDAHQTTLVAMITQGHARQFVALFIADGDDDGVNAVGTTIAFWRNELSEDDGGAAILGGITDVVLHRGIGWGVHHEFLGLRIVSGGGLQRLDVGAVTTLSHGEAAWQLETGGFLNPLDVTLGSQLVEGAAPQTPLHTGLNSQGAIDPGQALESKGRKVRLASTTVGAAQAMSEASEITHLGQVVKGVLALLCHGQMGLREELRVIEEGAQLVAEGGMGAVEKRAQLRSYGWFWRGGQAVGAAGLGLGGVVRGVLVEVDGGLLIGGLGQRHDGISFLNKFFSARRWLQRLGRRRRKWR